MMPLRCDQHRHFDLDPEQGVIEVRCRYCAHDGMLVFHRWNVRGERLADREEAEPTIRRFSRDDGKIRA